MPEQTATPLRTLAERLRPRLAALYGEQAEPALRDVLRACAPYADSIPPAPPQAWSERDTVLICYGDQVRGPRERPLAALKAFLAGAGLPRVFRTVHLLPFFPASSDDGFSVIDFRQVDPAQGTWDDVAALGHDFDLMFDLVLNHASAHGAWFRAYLAGQEPYARYFVEPPADADLSRVVRPRTSPLLTPVETARGPRRVWTTFSADQVDLNYREPRLLAEMLDILLGYLRRGARIVRLDAVAFLWKESGTPCVHLPQTHEVVKLLRDVIEILAPGALLLTETNVPHAENISYWGGGDEAHLVYNFSLAPLLLDALQTGDAAFLHRWLAETPPAPPGAGFLNFTASHDGVGVRPLEALLPEERVARLVEAVRARGGMVSARAGADGRETPYELNITYFDALGDPADPDPERHVARFLASQAIMLALRGVPAVYFHSLFGTPNDQAGAARTGRARSLNRRKFEVDELRSFLAESPTAGAVFNAYRKLLAARITQPAFHPDAPQELLEWGDSGLIGFLRGGEQFEPLLLVVAEIGGAPREVELRRHGLAPCGPDALRGGTASGASLRLAPYQVVWLPVRRIAASRSRHLGKPR